MRKKVLSSLFVIFMVFSICSCDTQDENIETNNGINSVNEDSGSADWPLADLEKYYGDTFGQGAVIDITVEINDNDWQDMTDNAMKEEYHPANITINGTTVHTVGIRTKGFSSLHSVAKSDSDRYGFKVKFDEYVDDQTLNGLDTLVLNGSFSDPSYMREYLTYAASQHLGCITPDFAYCNLSINGESFGFYLCIEAYDDSFVERYTDSADTVLYKADGETCTLLPDDDASGFDVDYGEDDDCTNIKNLIMILNNTTSENKSELENILDIDSVLKATAINTVMGNYDSYSGPKAHNYYLLYNEGRFSYIGWDYNMSIGGFSEDNGASVTVDISSPVYDVEISQRPLIGKLLAIDEYYERYIGYVNSLSEYFSGFDSQVSKIADTIRQYVENDPTAFYTIEQFESNITASDTDLSQVTKPGRSGGEKMQDGKMPDGDAPHEPPDGKTKPSMPDGYNPMEDSKNAYAMLNKNVVSIVDYITQRLSNIQSQL